jgi:hypothetical protein
VNKIGVKWALVIGAATFPIQGSAYYCNSKFGNQWVSSSDSVKKRFLETTKYVFWKLPDMSD